MCPIEYFEEFFPEKLFFHFFGYRVEIFRPFGKNFSMELSNLHSKCPEENFEVKHFLEKNMFFYSFSESAFLTENIAKSSSCLATVQKNLFAEIHFSVMSYISNHFWTLRKTFLPFTKLFRLVVKTVLYMSRVSF